MSEWDAEQNAIIARWRATCPVAAARRDESDLNGKAFTPPAIDPSSPASSIWVRLAIRASTRSGRPFGLGPTAPNYREGLIYQQIFYPRGFGEAFVQSYVEACWSAFHRHELSASAPNAQCRDSHPPDRIPADSNDASWRQINVVTPYFVID